MNLTLLGNRIRAAIFHPQRTARRAWFMYRHERSEPHDVLCRGAGYVLNVRSDSVLAKPLFAGHGFEEGEARILQRLVRPGMKVVDVGANIGLYSIMLGQRVGPKGHVWGFEPFPASAAYLRGNVARNNLSNVSVVEKAVADQVGVSPFFVFPEGGDVYNSLGAEKRAGEHLRAVRQMEVPVTTLDAFADEAGIEEVDFIKVDVEGAEERVMAGGRRLIQRSRNLAILSEMYEPSAVQCGCSTLRLAETMAGWGFALHGIGRNGGIHPATVSQLASAYALFMRKQGERS
jgi:FkbM family methyltransferase